MNHLSHNPVLSLFQLQVYWVYYHKKEEHVVKQLNVGQAYKQEIHPLMFLAFCVQSPS